MKDLLANYSLTEIITFLVLFALAFKAVATFWDWLWHWLRSKFDKDYECKEKEQALSNKVDEIYDLTMDQEKRINDINKSLKLLIESDKDNIKSWIVEKHHYFCYEVKAIDYYSLESIERRYEHYKAEDGNSYIATLIKELQALPKIESENIKKTMILDEQSH